MIYEIIGKIVVIIVILFIFFIVIPIIGALISLCLEWLSTIFIGQIILSIIGLSLLLFIIILLWIKL